MKHYTTNCSVPAVAITYAGALSSYQPIVFTSQLGFEDTGNLKSPDGSVIQKAVSNDSNLNLPTDSFKGRKLRWVINYMQINLVRDWPTSMANIVLIPNVPDKECPIPQLPYLGNIRGGNNPYLMSDDEIRIYMGYLSSAVAPITRDMLDEHPIDLCPQYTEDSSVGFQCTPYFHTPPGFKQTPSKPLCPVFWGFIDNINFQADESSGYKLVIQCRDRTRVFADTKIIAVPSLQGRLVDTSDNSWFGSKDKSGLASGRREDILIQVARASVGSLFEGSNTSRVQNKRPPWKPIIGGGNIEDNLYSPTWSNEKLSPRALGVQLFTAYEGDGLSHLVKNSPLEDMATWVREATHKVMLPHSEPRFHMWIMRPPLTKASGQAVFQVLGKSPMEIVQFLATTEELPTDFFCSHVNGDFMFAPRILDISGFYDPNRFYRTYFFKDYPGDDKPAPNQVIKSMRVVTSTLGTFNRYAVLDSETEGAFSAFIDNLRVTLDVLPWTLDGTKGSYGGIFDETMGRAVYPPSRNQIAYDGNLSSYGPKDFQRIGGALIVAISLARQWSRELHGIQLTIIGDPTFFPSEGIRVYNTVLHDFGTSVNPGTPESSSLFNETMNSLENLKEDSQSISELTGTYSPQEQDKAMKSFGTQEAAKTTEYANQALRSHTVETNKSNMVLPTYKVVAVRHTFQSRGRDPGFTTTLEANSDY